jgi:hypothetical protein
MMSSFLNLNKRDLINGFIVAFLATALAGVIASLEAGNLPSMAELQAGAILGIKAAAAYLLKNLFTNSNDQLLKGE